ncbi:alpha/beta hydrolase [Epilithonimonas ginsengisoli]|uniref:Alpha/beta hydrolase n=1 Tax=Epilithonimonas ginsengisoli TaxID=1245592 RepID=A0ABU4JJ70_9FLAO|nr:MULTISPECIES: alpha/beta hydrolase [Chryseobacterium group]MBV6880858.1 alpha/beta hydrolase [Epilithonimonas sp. FP105]MDW8549571.1 alpha/beta hydrolase [Epilithonimonas ginsengisoli]OAH76704.1 alpha/beta hydrolase [Chryseobacterium sp. FP211-J200]
MSKIYIFSGLGVDRRVFDNIDFGNLDVEFVDWIDPLKNEPLENYTKRISQKITHDNPILIGLSFGGMVAVEISKIIKTEKIILIGSAKNKFELPKFNRISGKLKLNKLIPKSIFKKQNLVTNWIFGIETDSEKQLLKEILKDTDPNFFSWAINEIVNWKNHTIPENVIHIHGNKDRIIPFKNVKADFVIEGGGHFMTVNRSKEIQEIILHSVPMA